MRDIASQLDRDEAFVEQVYRASAPGLVGAAYALTGDRAEAEDVVQEAFIRALAQPGKVAAADSPGAWMRVVALNIARSRFRRRQTHDRLVRQLPLADERLPEPGPDRVMLVAAIGQLPYEQREAVTLYYLADLSLGRRYRRVAAGVAQCRQIPAPPRPAGARRVARRRALPLGRLTLVRQFAAQAATEAVKKAAKKTSANGRKYERSAWQVTGIKRCRSLRRCDG
ncbi:RNA polymerase sigma factor [Fodinicola feengrottensis]|uniref:RNA polymerase sigma factor n=1 Tax=Fodinicola feengrottensis TaxID=435914 RepID=UPI0013D5CDEA|nr:sigma-70 family RNA polymerase sigma factor [Fodinicola feengrottensis]